ncbi:MAG: hypothetical protein VKQ33_09545, partial [Candidatus Sericytochromatia bacterium]|nr:hypothetical protein [Candidatus Sericytochromatia bacterium]
MSRPPVCPPLLTVLLLTGCVAAPRAVLAPPPEAAASPTPEAAASPTPGPTGSPSPSAARTLTGEVRDLADAPLAGVTVTARSL